MNSYLRTVSRYMTAFMAIIFCTGLFVHAAMGAGALYIIVNPGSDDLRNNAVSWRSIINQERIYEWGRSRGLHLVADHSPLNDGWAGYLLPYGTVISIKGLNEGKEHWLWIDFVTFRGDKKSKYISPLSITMRSRITGAEYEQKILPDEMEPGKLFCMKIPYDITAANMMEIEFREDAPLYGGWGIWDIIISDSSQLPAKIYSEETKNKSMNIREKISQ